MAQGTHWVHANNLKRYGKLVMISVFAKRQFNHMNFSLAQIVEAVTQLDKY